MDSEFKNRLRLLVPIDSYISKYVPLKKAGRSLIGLCPFHKEKSPSFHVNLQGGYYHCFGCKASGDIFQFAMSYHKVDFVGAMELLATYAGVTVPKFNKEKDSAFSEKKEKLTALLQKTTDYYMENLHSPKGSIAKQYLENRGVSSETIQIFRIGFAEEGFQNLPANLFSQEERNFLLELGVLKKQEGRDPYCFFRGRIMFPISDPTGKVIGYTARILDSKSEEAKYINSPNSILYDKGRTLYNFSLAIDKAKQTRKILIVEGVLDAIGLYSKGIQNVVAPLGTAFTELQARILKSVAEEVVMVLDGDSAGKKGAIRAMDVLSKEGIVSKAVVLPEGKDPFDLSKEWSLLQWRESIDSAIPASEYIIKDLLSGAKSGSTLEEKNLALRKVYEFVKQRDQETEKESFLQVSAKELGLSFASVLSDFKKGGAKDQFRPANSDIQEGRIVKEVNTNERKILAKMIWNPALLEFHEQMDSYNFSDNDCSIVWGYLFTRFFNQEEISPSVFFASEEIDSKIKSSFAPFLDAVEESNDADFAHFSYLLFLLKDSEKEREIQSLLKQSKFSTGDEKANYLKKITDLQAERKKDKEAFRVRAVAKKG